MNDGLDYQPTADEIWPPAPTLPPPEWVRPSSFISLHPVLARILISISSGLLSAAMFTTLRFFTRGHQAMVWAEAAIPGCGMFIFQLVIQFWLPHEARKQERMRLAVLRAKALAAQAATD